MVAYDHTDEERKDKRDELLQLKARIAELEREKDESQRLYCVVHNEYIQDVTEMRQRAEKAEAECERIWERVGEIIDGTSNVNPNLSPAVAFEIKQKLNTEREKWRK